MEQQVVLSKEDLKAILRANSETILEVVRELKKPTEMEQKELDRQAAELKARQEERKTNSASVRQKIKDDQATKLICSHEHPNGDSHCVWVQEQRGPGYLLCQKNQCIIRPGDRPAGDSGHGFAIYSTEMFNKIFQKIRVSGADIIG